MSFSIHHAREQASRRYRQIRNIWTAEGLRGISRRARGAVANRIGTHGGTLPVRSCDVIAADLSRPSSPPVPPVKPGVPLVVNWVSTPAGPGAGGHMTLHRIVRQLRTQGYVNRIYLYDTNHVDQRYYESVLRDFYGFDGPVANVDRGMEDAHAVVATSWMTAYPVYNAQCAGKRFYLVQDYEPFFYPVGAESLLAENTYRMGMHGITAGKWLAAKLCREFGMAAEHFELGADTSCYRPLAGRARDGVAFYARREVARRGYELGLMALELFATRRPDVQLHFFGDRIGRLPFPFIDHGRVAPGGLNDIYNQCRAGLCLSLTNASLVPHEMLAAGCIPVVNDGEHNRTVLDNACIRYVPLDPQAVAAELEALTGMRDFEPLSVQAADSVRFRSWEEAGAAVDAVFRGALTGSSLDLDATVGSSRET
jgi:O-antigen biosynthesis protein